MDKQLAKMPPGIERMSKEELYDLYHRHMMAVSEQHNQQRMMCGMTTGLHPSYYRFLNQPQTIIELQMKRIRGLEMQMQQMNKGYQKKFAKLTKEAKLHNGE